jgi:hypothetical protein
VHGFFCTVHVLRNRPAAGRCRGLAESHVVHHDTPIRQRSWGSIYTDCPSQLSSSHDLLGLGRVLTCSQATLPHAVEPRAARNVFDVRHRCPEPADLVSGPGPSCAPASGLSPRRPAVPTNWCSPA